MEPPPSKQVGMGVIGLQRSQPLHLEGISHLMSLSWVRKGNSRLLAMPAQELLERGAGEDTKCQPVPPRV